MVHVDDEEANVKKAVNAELLTINTQANFLRLHLMNYDECLPIYIQLSAIKSVNKCREYYSSYKEYIKELPQEACDGYSSSVNLNYEITAGFYSDDCIEILKSTAYITQFLKLIN